MDYTAVAAALFAAFVLYVLGRALAVPLKLAGLVLYRTLLGGVALLAINLVGRWLGLHLPVNPISSAVAGLLGLPGIGLLFALQRVLAAP